MVIQGDSRRWVKICEVEFEAVVLQMLLVFSDKNPISMIFNFSVIRVGVSTIAGVLLIA